MAFFISRETLFFCSFRFFCVSTSSLIWRNKSLCSSEADDEDLPALLDSLGGGRGEAGAADAAPHCSVGLSPAPEQPLLPASVMAQTHKASRLVVSKKQFAALELFTKLRTQVT